MDVNYELIGVRIKRYRENKGLSQEELGDIINSTERHVRRIEGGHCGVSLNLLVSIANALGASVPPLFFRFLSAYYKSLYIAIGREEIRKIRQRECPPTMRSTGRLFMPY